MVSGLKKFTDPVSLLRFLDPLECIFICSSSEPTTFIKSVWVFSSFYKVDISPNKELRDRTRIYQKFDGDNNSEQLVEARQKSMSQTFINHLNEGKCGDTIKKITALLVKGDSKVSHISCSFHDARPFSNRLMLPVT